MTTCPSYTDFPATCGPCGSQGDGGEGCLGNCGAPINLENGSPRMSRSYLRTANGDFQMSWFNRYLQNGAAANPTRGLGKNWSSANFAYQLDQGDGTFGFLWDPTQTGLVDFFSESGGDYTTCNCSLDQLTESGNDFLVTAPDGSVTTFDKTTGLMSKHTTPGGQETNYTYNSGINRISEMRRTHTAGGNTNIESRLFGYLTSGANTNELQYVTLRQAEVASPSSGDWNSLSRIELQYYGSSETHGNLGDLKLIKQQVLVGTSWVDKQIEYFRYYKDSAGGTGYQHGLKFVLSPQGYANMVADSLTPETATDVVLAPYASNYFEYDANRRVKTAKVAGGNTTFSVVYSENTGISFYDYNHWLRKAVLTTPDSAIKTVYSNNIGQDLLVDLVHGTDQWISYTKYDENARVIERVQPSAIDMSGTPYNEASDNLAVQIKTSDGLIKVTTYYAAGDTDPAAAPGRQKLSQVKKGSGGTVPNGRLITLSKLEYESHTVGSGATARTVYPVTKRIVYQSASSGGSSGAATEYTNTFHSGTTQPMTVEESLPSVSGQNGGSWSGSDRERHFDVQGRLIKTVDTRDIETTYEYDDLTGAVVESVQDAESGGLQLTTEYESDEWGRTTQVLGPSHNVDETDVQTAQWTVYKDEENEIWSGRGYFNGTDYTLINPVSITRRDKNGRTVDEIQATRGSGVEDSGQLVESNTFAQTSWTRWTHYEYGDDGRVSATRVYHTIPSSDDGSSGTNYDATTYGYDSMGRQNKTTSPGGTIQKTFFDVRNLATETKVGTIDGGGSDNMRTIVVNQYDGGSDGGDGNLTRVTRPVDATSGNDRITRFEYDWRDRQIATISVEHSTLEFRIERTLDNLGRALIVEDKRDVSSTLTLIGKREALYDNRGRVYQTKRYAVSSGTAGNALIDNTWYDGEGNVLESLPAGSLMFTKSVYDAIGRYTASYLGYYSGSGGDNPDSVANDVIFEESNTQYDTASNVMLATTKQRWHNATGNGALNGPSGSQPKSRDSFVATLYDGIGRSVATADYGTYDNDGPPDPLPESPPSSSATVLVNETSYYASGEVEELTDPKGKVTKSDYDDAGRIVKTTRNHGSTPTEEVETSYTADGQVESLTAINADAGGTQETVYTYGVVLANSAIEANNLLRKVTYPDSGEVLFEYNRQGQRTKMTDQNGSVHEYVYDQLGRQTHDKVTTVGSGVDGAVRRIEWVYDSSRRLHHVTSYTATSGGSVVNDVEYVYNGFSQVSTELQQHGAATSGSSPKVEYLYANGSANTIRRERCTYPDGRVVNYEYGTSGGANDKLSRVQRIEVDSTDVVEYEYLGLSQVVIQKYLEPSSDVIYTLATGSSPDPYTGLDSFGRIIDLRWVN